VLGDCSGDECKALPLFRFNLFWVLVGCMLDLETVEACLFLVTYLCFVKVNTICSKLLASGCMLPMPSFSNVRRQWNASLETREALFFKFQISGAM